MFCSFRHQNKLLWNFLILGKSRFPPKKFLIRIPLLTIYPTAAKRIRLKVDRQGRNYKSAFELKNQVNISFWFTDCISSTMYMLAMCKVCVSWQAILAAFIALNVPW